MRNTKTEELKHVLAKKGIFFIPKGEENNERLASTALKNITDLGFTLPKEGYDNLKTASKEDITNWYNDTVKVLLEITGENHEYKPFYPNFPDEVMEMDEFEMFINQIAHYWFGYMPEGVDQNAGIKSLEEHPLNIMNTFEYSPENVVDKGGEMFSNFLKSKQNISASQIEYISKFIDCVPSWNKFVNKIENRNLLCTMYETALYDNKDVTSFPKLVTNDYLKIASISNYFKKDNNMDLESKIQESLYQLTENESIKNLKSVPRSTRRFIVEGLSNQRNLEEDVARNKNQFKVLFKLIHAGEYKNIASENFNDVVNKVRNNIKLETFYSKVDKAFMDKDVSKAINLLKTRPGEFVKSINRIINADIGENDINVVLKDLTNACDEVFLKTRPEDLFSLAKYLDSRQREERLPIHNVKGILVMGDKSQNPLIKEIAEDIRARAVNGIIKQVAANKNWKNVYIEPGMYNMAMPLKIKESTETYKTYPKGSVLPIEKNENNEPKNIRLGVWWTNNEYNHPVDIDLSVDFYKDDTLRNMTLSYLDQNAAKAYNCFHSGDITDGGKIDGNGAAEFIDLDMKKLKEAGFKYARTYVNIYGGAYNFRELTNCEFSIQEREELNKSEKYDIKAIKQHSKITSLGCGATECIVDIPNGEIYWIDEPDRAIKQYENINSQSAVNSFNVNFDTYCKKDGINMGELIEAIANEVGAEIVDTPEKAENIFSVNQCDYEDKNIVTSTDIDIWLGEYMSPQNTETQEKEREKTVEQENKEEIIKSIADLKKEDLIKIAENEITNNENKQVNTEEQSQSDVNPNTNEEIPDFQGNDEEDFEL